MIPLAALIVGAYAGYRAGCEAGWEKALDFFESRGIRLVDPESEFIEDQREVADLQ